MFNEMISNLVNVVLAVWVVYLGFTSKLSGASKTVGMYIVWAGVVLGVAELIDMFQIFPDGTFLADLMYEKEIPVLILLGLALMVLKGKK